MKNISSLLDMYLKYIICFLIIGKFTKLNSLNNVYNSWLSVEADAFPYHPQNIIDNYYYSLVDLYLDVIHSRASLNSFPHISFIIEISNFITADIISSGRICLTHKRQNQYLNFIVISTYHL